MNATLRWILTVVCVVLGSASIYNVMSDNDDVRKLAEKLACADMNTGAACKPQMTRMERSPFSQTFELVTSKRTYEVRCTRSLVLFGDYSCGSY